MSRSPELRPDQVFQFTGTPEDLTRAFAALTAAVPPAQLELLAANQWRFTGSREDFDRALRLFSSWKRYVPVEDQQLQAEAHSRSSFRACLAFWSIAVLVGQYLRPDVDGSLWWPVAAGLAGIPASLAVVLITTHAKPRWRRVLWSA